ncbi:MAG: serine hydroxymethyltransferase [Candidatus Portnoybacteria bacterium]|nr:serine hydroxymethyltransferase [Candidatus Portnoybacteria bacterium]
MKSIKQDKEFYEILKAEEKYQRETIRLIPSENFASPAVLQALGSVFTNKYSEGEPGRRYYQGNENVDKVELLAVERVKKLFGLGEDWHVNVKAISAGIANLAVFNALLEPGQKMMAMHLLHGGHVSHGWDMPDGRKVTISSKLFTTVRYLVDEKTEVFDYDEIEKMAIREKPQVIVSGGTAYPRDIRYKRMGEIAKKVGAYYFADVAHEAGLIGAGVLSSPFPYADVVSMSTQKTLRGPRASIVCCRKELAKRIDRSIFPGVQAGPFDNNIAALCVALKEALSADFRKHAEQVVKNAKAFAKALQGYGFDLISGGTDKHLILIDLRNKGVDGTNAALLLEKAHIITNKNTIPYDTGSPMKPSGFRVGTPAMTTRGFKERDFEKAAEFIDDVITQKRPPELIKRAVLMMLKNFNK